MKIGILICLFLTGCADSVICGVPQNFLINEINQMEQVNQSTEN